MGLVSVEGADGLEGKILQKFCWAYKHIAEGADRHVGCKGVWAHGHIGCVILHTLFIMLIIQKCGKIGTTRSSFGGGKFSFLGLPYRNCWGDFPAVKASPSL